jgi:drug/metabolite transporter (DMT)-like permease
MRKRGSPTVTAEAPAGLAAVALAAGLWALGATVASDLFASGVSPFELAEARAVVAMIGLALLPGSWAARRGPIAPTRTLAFGLSLALVNLTYYFAIDRLAVAVAIVLEYTAPVLVIAWAALVARRPPSREVVAALVAAVSGVILVSGLLAGGVGTVDGLGIAMGLAAAVFFSIYTVLSEDTGAAFGPLGAMFRGFVIASAFWVLFQIPQGWPSTLFESDHIPKVLFVGLGGTLLPFLLYVWGIGRVRAERAAIAATLEPPIGGVIAWVWLGQTLTVGQIAGGLLVIGAILLLNKRPHLDPSPFAPEP